MIIEINVPKWYNRLAYAWRCFKKAWTDYEHIKWGRNLPSKEAQELFEVLYNKHYPTAQAKVQSYKDTGLLPIIGKPKMSKGL